MLPCIHRAMSNLLLGMLARAKFARKTFVLRAKHLAASPQPVDSKRLCHWHRPCISYRCRYGMPGGTGIA